MSEGSTKSTKSTNADPKVDSKARGVLDPGELAERLRQLRGRFGEFRGRL